MSRNIPDREEKVLIGKSGGMCAFPGCRKRLMVDATATDDAVFLGEMAHIVGDSHQGPRGKDAMTDEERDKASNLILLCRDHHKLIDSQLTRFSVGVLRQMKHDHESWVDRQTGAVAVPTAPPEDMRTETIHSTLLPITHLPAAVFAAPCTFRERQEDLVRQRIKYPDNEQLVRFLLAEGKLWTFHNLRDPTGPFASVIEPMTAENHESRRLWCDPDGCRRYVALLNKAMFKHADCLGVRFDPCHRRYHFVPREKGKPRKERYKPLNAKWESRDVVWQPKKKATNEVRDFWFHLAAGLNFHQFGTGQWCLSVRPERHLTTDGETPLESKRIGRRVTRRKARMWNDVYLSEVNFWRYFLAGGRPQLVLDFGDQSAVIDTRLADFEVRWPGIPGDERQFKNQTFEQDLFSHFELSNAVEGGLPDWGASEHDGEEADDE